MKVNQWTMNWSCFWSINWNVAHKGNEKQRIDWETIKSTSNLRQGNSGTNHKRGEKAIDRVNRECFFR